MKFLTLFLIQLLYVSGFSQNQSKTDNIIIITLDGLRWQELFTGADQGLISDKAFVKDTAALYKSFWRATSEQRREVLMPFFWGKINEEGQLYGFRDVGSKVNCTNTHWFSYPGYSEILCGFADDQRINSNDKFNNPNTTVLEFINGNQQF